jgi:hypothetical protein
MAETKTRPSKAKPQPRASNKSKAGTAGKPKKARSPSRPKRRSTSKPKTTATSKPKTAASKPAISKPQAARAAVTETAKDAGGVVGRAASKAKVPLMAGGAALAGAAGGLALGTRQAHHRKNGLGGVSSKDLAKAARKAGDVGAQVGEIALEVRRARESTNGHGKAHRSPIEVVLQGLTSRG